jgi:uncharacterized membrane protein YphA (DoxX/SURF4 family)
MTTYPIRTGFSATDSFAERISLRLSRYSSVLLRAALGVGFLSAVADRFGWWGPFGVPNVDWGNFPRFLEYTQRINWFVPAEWILTLGIIATVAEIVLGLLLLIGWYTRVAALLSALLLLTFGVAMMFGLGVKAPLNYSVFTGMGGSLLLANCQNFPLSLDQLRLRRTHLAENG